MLFHLIYFSCCCCCQCFCATREMLCLQLSIWLLVCELYCEFTHTNLFASFFFFIFCSDIHIIIFVTLTRRRPSLKLSVESTCVHYWTCVSTLDAIAHSWIESEHIVWHKHCLQSRHNDVVVANFSLFYFHVKMASLKNKL